MHVGILYIQKKLQRWHSTAEHATAAFLYVVIKQNYNLSYIEVSLMCDSRSQHYLYAVARGTVSRVFN